MAANRWIGLGILAVAGLLVAHEIAYALATAAGIALGAEASLDHGHIGVLWTVFGPLLGLVVGRTAVQRVHRMRLDHPVRLSQLAPVMAAGFLAVEIGERAATGASATAALTEPVIFLGLGLCLPTAWLLTRVSRAVDHALAALSTLVETVSVPAIAVLVILTGTPNTQTAAPERLRHVVSRRGPPLAS